MPDRPKVSRVDLIDGPYRECPNKKCFLSIPSYGVLMNIDGSRNYTRECYVCGHTETFSFPQIRKKIVYLDQFVLSNLLKLLDKEHPRHETLMADSQWRTRWEQIFLALERARQFQVMVCPDSFTHRDESLLHNVDFKLSQRMYEHYSDGKTLYSSVDIQRFQLTKHFDSWLKHIEYIPEIQPDDICQHDLHTWSVGMKITIEMPPYPREIANLTTTTKQSQDSITRLWQGWSDDKNTSFFGMLHLETGSIGKALMGVIQTHQEKRIRAMNLVAQGQDFDVNDMLPPPAVRTISDLINIAVTNGVPEKETATIINNYFLDTESLLQIPNVRISSYMYAALARRAQLGQKKVPKSLTDVTFISSYLPYCDAIFVDIESAELLSKLPKEMPKKYNPNVYGTKIFSLNNLDEFVLYLESLVNELPDEHKKVLLDITESNHEPYWDLINHTRSENDTSHGD